MNEIKPWYQSKAVWGALIAVAASAVRVGGIELGLEDQGQLADAAVSLAGTIGGLLALYGRVSAKNRIG
ncbi:hypothetical protein DFR52_102891 [Hoeflea marina]|uniref:Holin n=1 Tax=Hoeflea marina TaxID=274592 RepID=A0A317PNR9_9HYPH|nr:hypothetical protein [Hoeflea marina]PWW02223.1 hypothetical protein DFR52_102891 [Hoeflea marina]